MGETIDEVLPDDRNVESSPLTISNELRACRLDSWSLDSWKSKHASQAVLYDDLDHLGSACATLSRLPALVRPVDIEAARSSFSEVSQGKAFIIQGGDCAESFSDVTVENVAGHVSLLSEQARILSKAMNGRPVVQIGRIAGQYAKPRSKLYEAGSGTETVYAYRGDNVNSVELHRRNPDPERLVLGYLYASSSLHTISMVRGLQSVDGGKEETRSGPGAFYTSHEALHLPLESALTRGEYNTSAAFLWIGERTRQIDGAHVEYMRGLRNPIGIKIGPTSTPEEVVRLLDTLSATPARNAEKTSDAWGRVTLITRLGAGNVNAVLRALIPAVQLSGHRPVWMCDPCHGNTRTTVDGRKTRIVETVLKELKETYMVHRELNSLLGGIHLEQTGELVTECIDSVRVTRPEDLAASYKSLCDPRLARDQAICLVQDFAAFVESYKEDTTEVVVD